MRQSSTTRFANGRLEHRHPFKFVDNGHRNKHGSLQGNCLPIIRKGSIALSVDFARRNMRNGNLLDPNASVQSAQFVNNIFSIMNKWDRQWAFGARLQLITTLSDIAPTQLSTTDGTSWSLSWSSHSKNPYVSLIFLFVYLKLDTASRKKSVTPLLTASL